MKQTAFVRRLYDGAYYLIAGVPEDVQNIKLVSRHGTRREAIRHGKRDGYDIIIKNRAAEQDKKSLLGNLAAAKQRVASQQATTQAATVSKSKPSGLEV